MWAGTHEYRAGDRGKMSLFDLNSILKLTIWFTFNLDSIRYRFVFIYMWPWSTKPVISVNILNLRFNIIWISWINNIYIDVWFVDNIWKIWNLRVQKNLNIEKIIFKVVQMKFLATHITNQKWSFDMFMVWNVLNIFMEHDLNILMIFGIK